MEQHRFLRQKGLHLADGAREASRLPSCGASAVLHTCARQTWRLVNTRTSKTRIPKIFIFTFKMNNGRRHAHSQAETPAFYFIFSAVFEICRNQQELTPQKTPCLYAHQTPQNVLIREIRTKPTTLLALISPGLAFCTPGRTKFRKTGNTSVQSLGESVNPKKDLRLVHTQQKQRY